MSNELVRLRRYITNHYNLDEFRSLCFDLGIDYEELGEGGKTVKVQEFLLLVGHLHGFDRLLRQLKEDKPKPFLEEDFAAIPEAVFTFNRAMPDFAKAGELNTRSSRNRHNLLANIKHTWVEEGLKKSIYKEILIELGKAVDYEAVGHTTRPWRLVLQQGDKQSPISSQKSILEIFEENGRNLLILGEPASGKTITLLQLAYVLLKNAEEDPEHPIPVVLNLSSWAQEQRPFSEWLEEEMLLNYTVAKPFTQFWLDRDELLLLLDGLDEVEAAHRDGCVQAINQFKKTFAAEMVVCSRTVDYEPLKNRLNLNAAVCIQPLTIEQAKDFLGKVGDSIQGFRQALDRDEKLQKLVESPLMLNLVPIAYDGVPRDEIMPIKSVTKSRIQLFTSYIQQVFYRRPLSKKTGYDTQQALDWLVYLARGMQKQGQPIFQIERLQPTWLPPVKERRFRINMFFFFILLGALVGVLFGTLFSITFRDLAFGRFFGMIVGLFGSLSGGLFFGFFFGRGDIHLPETLQWSWSRLRTRFRERDFYFTILNGGLLFGLIGSLVFGLGISPFFGLVIGLIGILNGSILGGLFGLATKGWTASEVKKRSIPNQGIRLLRTNAIRAGLVFGLVGGLVGGLANAMVFGLGVSLVSGLYSGLICGLVDGLYVVLFVVLVGGLSASLGNGGEAVIKNSFLRRYLWRDNLLPVNLESFLDTMADRILLHRTGGGWRFIHRYLLEHFASMDEEEIHEIVRNLS